MNVCVCVQVHVCVSEGGIKLEIEINLFCSHLIWHFSKWGRRCPRGRKEPATYKNSSNSKENLNFPYHENSSDLNVDKQNYLSTVAWPHRMKPNSTLFSKKPYPFL